MVTSVTTDRPADGAGSRAPNGLRVLTLSRLSGFDLRAMECLQILDGARSAEVERVLPDTHVPRVVALSLRNMRELVLDGRAFPHGGASRRRVKLLAQALLQPFVCGDRHGAAVAEFSGGALPAPRTGIADIRIELDGGAKRDRL